MDEVKKILSILSGWIMKISPPLPIGGLQITDFAIRYVQFKGGGAIRGSLKLQPGVVSGGRIKNKETFVAALSELHRRVHSNSRQSISVVLSLQIVNVYVQPFSVPSVAEGNFEEAVGLNAEMISPIDVEKSYRSWQRVEDGVDASGSINLLGAFVRKEIVDEFVGALEEANFGIAAVEFASMSLVRDIENKKIVKGGKPYIVIGITAAGLSFIVARKGVPHFHYLHSWAEVQGDGNSVSLDNLKLAFETELSKVIKFFTTRWSGKAMTDVVIITPSFANEIGSLLEKKFKGLKAKILQPQEVGVAEGAAIRGLMPRSQDMEISLSSLSAMDVFENQQIVNFTRIWRNVFVTALGFLLAVFVASNIFARQEFTKLAQDVNSFSGNPDIEEFDKLRQDATQFNELVESAYAIRSQGNDLSPFISKMGEIAGEEITITRLSFQSLDTPALINGNAPNQDAAVRFKNRVVEQAQFTDVDLPLANVSDDGNKVLFTLTFKINSLDF